MTTIVEQSGGHLIRNLLLFGRVCKAAGMAINPHWMLDAAQALESIPLANQEDFFYSLRALMVTRQPDLDLFDQIFAAFWQIPGGSWLTTEPGQTQHHINQKGRSARPGEESLAGTPDTPDQTGQREGIAVIPTYSQREVLRQKDFGEMTDDELLIARHLMGQLRWGFGSRKTRRLRSGSGASLDVRQTLRQSSHFGGEIVALPTRAPKIKPRPVVLLCDIGGSMERYTRMLLHFMHTLTHSRVPVESFVFATQLTHITRVIQHKSIDLALREIGGAILDWGGGTRIGETLHTFNYRWARRVLGRGAILLLITDGWDRGDPALLRNEAQRLQRNCHRLIWLNPLIGRFQYEPLTRGSQALLPFVDDFLPVRNLDALDNLVRELQRVDWRRPERVAHAHLIRKSEVSA